MEFCSVKFNCSSYYFSKKKKKASLPLHQRFQKAFAEKIKYQKNFSEILFRELKQHQHNIRSKTAISLEITRNVFKRLIVSLVPLKFLPWQQHHFCLFQLASCLSLNLLWCQECTFYCAPRKKRYTFFSKGSDVHIQQPNHQKNISPCQSLYYYDKVLFEQKKRKQKHKQGI